MRRSITSLVLVLLFAGCAGADNVAGPSASEIGRVGGSTESSFCEGGQNDEPSADDLAFQKACHRDPAVP
jgi:hypothetical protein